MPLFAKHVLWHSDAAIWIIPCYGDVGNQVLMEVELQLSELLLFEQILAKSKEQLQLQAYEVQVSAMKVMTLIAFEGQVKKMELMVKQLIDHKKLVYSVLEGALLTLMVVVLCTPIIFLIIVGKLTISWRKYALLLIRLYCFSQAKEKVLKYMDGCQLFRNQIGHMSQIGF